MSSTPAPPQSASSLAGRRRRLKGTAYGWGEYPASSSPSWRGLGESQGLFHFDILHLDICLGTNAPAVDIAASQIGRRRRYGRTRLRILRRLYSLSLSTARFLSHVTTIANHDCRCYRPYGTSFAHCGRSSQRAIKGAAVSIFVSPNRSERSTRRPSELSSG